MTNPALRLKLRPISLLLILICLFFVTSPLIAASKATIKNIQYQKFKDYFRLTIYITGHLEYSKNRISKPERFYFELKNSTIPKKIESNFNIEDGIAKPVMIGQLDEDTVVVVLDLDKIKDFKEHLLTNPTRLVIDIYTDTISTHPSIKEPDVIPAAPIQPEPPADTTKPDITQKTVKVIESAYKKEPGIPLPPAKPEVDIKTKERADTLMSSGAKYFEAGEYEKALLDFRKAAELSPGHPETYLFIGRSLFKLGEKEEAIAAYKQALEYDPNSADAYNGLGYAYYAQGKPSNAVDAFLMAIRLNPEHDDAHAGLGYTYLTIGDINSAIEHYRILKGLDSNKADELFHLIFKVQMKEQTKEQPKTFK